MSKILFINHTYHQKTQSSNFIVDLLLKNKANTVNIASINPYAKNKESDLLKFQNIFFDIIILWQLIPTFKNFNKLSFKRIVFFPMFDACHSLGIEHWISVKNILIISFSKILHKRLKKWGLNTHYFQYFPNPQKNIDNKGDLESCFFFQRNPDIEINKIIQLTNYVIKKAHIHEDLDPRYKKKDLPKIDKKNISITRSTWFEKKEDLEKKMKKSAIYIAPRKYEGIGMAFLHAMSIGRCVIAPDFSTMNEYIKSGHNGILYNLDSVKNIKIKNIRDIQSNTIQFMERGYNTWKIKQKNLVDLIFLDNQKTNYKLWIFYFFLIKRIVLNPSKILKYLGSSSKSRFFSILTNKKL